MLRKFAELLIMSVREKLTAAAAETRQQTIKSLHVFNVFTNGCSSQLIIRVIIVNPGHTVTLLGAKIHLCFSCQKRLEGFLFSPDSVITVLIRCEVNC